MTMVLIIVFLSLVNPSIASHGVPWHLKFGYQNIDGIANTTDDNIQGMIFSYEKLFNRQVHSYFSTYTEISYSSVDLSITEDLKLYQYGLGLKWNFGPTDFDYEQTADYAYVLNQGSIYLKAGLGYLNVERDGPEIVKDNDFAAQYGLGYELLGKRTGFYLEYLKSGSEIVKKGIMRAGVNWRF